MSGSFPFMAIARRYGLDYGDVLIYAQIHRTGARPAHPHEFRAIDRVSAVEPAYAACNAILGALL